MERFHLSALWRMPLSTVSLGPDDVHVWCASLDATQLYGYSFEAVLADDERRRADRFLFPQDRTHFVAARGTLRVLLSRYLKLAPDAVPFCYTVQGKPFLADRIDHRFNISHTHGLGLFAMTLGREIGVDIEWVRRRVAYQKVAKRFFSAPEVAALCQLPPDQQRAGFFNCWTRKEAFIKARGTGLQEPLDGFAVSLAPGDSARLILVRDDPAEVNRWRMESLYMHPDYVGALVVEGHDWTLSCWQAGTQSNSA